MAAFDFSIRTRLAAWAGVAVVMVAGMLVEQQYGDYSAWVQRRAADGRQLAAFEAMGCGKFPICMAKTQYSFSTNPDAKGAPTDHIINVREVRLSAGAEFVVAICGEIMTMPGLPKVPAADSIDIGPDGRIVGLF